MNIGDFEIQLIDFMASSLWVSKFIHLRKSLETAQGDNGTYILTCCLSLLEKFDCLKKVALAMLLALISTYLCEHIFFTHEVHSKAVDLQQIILKRVCGSKCQNVIQLFLN